MEAVYAIDLTPLFTSLQSSPTGLMRDDKEMWLMAPLDMTNSSSLEDNRTISSIFRCWYKVHRSIGDCWLLRLGVHKIHRSFGATTTLHLLGTNYLLLATLLILTISRCFYLYLFLHFPLSFIRASYRVSFCRVCRYFHLYRQFPAAFLFGSLSFLYRGKQALLLYNPPMQPSFHLAKVGHR